MKLIRSEFYQNVGSLNAALPGSIIPDGYVKIMKSCLHLRKYGFKLPSFNCFCDDVINFANRFLEEPLRQLSPTLAVSPRWLAKIIEDKGDFGYNAATEEYGDLIKMGVVDPTKVTRSALQNAASIASLILTADVMIANLPEKKEAAVGQINEMGM